MAPKPRSRPAGYYANYRLRRSSLAQQEEEAQALRDEVAGLQHEAQVVPDGGAPLPADLVDTRVDGPSARRCDGGPVGGACWSTSSGQQARIQQTTHRRRRSTRVAGKRLALMVPAMNDDPDVSDDEDGDFSGAGDPTPPSASTASTEVAEPAPRRALVRRGEPMLREFSITIVRLGTHILASDIDKAKIWLT